MVHRPDKKRFSGGWRLFVYLLMLLSLLGGSGVAEGFEAATLKAALVLNFAKFTTWPPDAFAGPEADMELWVLGDTIIQQAFASIDGETIGSRKIHVRHAGSVSATDPCHMLFVALNVDRPILTAALASVWDRPVLSVGETSEFIQLGGIINIFNKDGRYHFEIKPAAANQRGLKLSSRLLKLAIVLGD
ncbi:conserved hypothetical protein [Desulfosarcina cetonica]|uniref:YfiR family protein n=1 Tax=Desulfosarcina cetonica TaxID=90730 RepID=UPI0006CFA602|nr:YfiR family protein [Desulfosarcina cetonica]VTR69729.1 conserved hypothetical protein [Desulfosarcina cetonica]